MQQPPSPADSLQGCLDWLDKCQFEQRTGYGGWEVEKQRIGYMKGRGQATGAGRLKERGWATYSWL